MPNVGSLNRRKSRKGKQRASELAELASSNKCLAAPALNCGLSHSSVQRAPKVAPIAFTWPHWPTNAPTRPRSQTNLISLHCNFNCCYCSSSSSSPPNCFALKLNQAERSGLSAPRRPARLAATLLLRARAARLQAGRRAGAMQPLPPPNGPPHSSPGGGQF